LTGRVVVTGCGGFIGAHLCRRLVEEGYSVTGADLRDPGIPDVRFVRCDVSDRVGFSGLPKKADCVVHLAGIAYVPAADADFVKAYDVNFLGAYNALRYHAASGSKTFIFSSSSKVYGNPQRLPVGESHPLNPTNAYGRTKKAAEALMAEFAGDAAGGFVALRQFNIYGPGQAGDFFIPTLMSQLAAGGGLRLGDLGVRRDFLYVGDLVDAYLMLMDARPGGFSVFNAGSGESAALTEVVSAAAALFGRSPQVSVEAARVRAEVPDVYADVGRLKAMGWRPKTTLAEGLGKMKGA
jgi:GDP-4-dehydro-6-deoxy-D-mannose reductase